MKLLKLISPVIAAIVASLLALSAIIIFFTGRLDSNSLEAEKRLLSDLVNKIPLDLQIIAEDNSWWDEALDHIYFSEDMPWIAGTVGGTADDIGSIDGVFVLRPDNSIIFSLDNRQNAPSLAELFGSGMADAIARMEPSGADEGVVSSGFVISGQRVFALGIGMLQRSGSKVYDPPLDARRRPVIIFYQEVDQRTTQGLAEDLELSELVFDTEHTDQTMSSKDAFLTVYGMNDVPVGRLTWIPATPGSSFLEALFWPAIFFLGVITIAIWSFVQRARALVSELEQADRAKTAFLASMSHEVRTPLNAIIGFAEILRLGLHGEIKGEKNNEYLDIIRSSGEHLLTVINDILDISKLDAGKMEVFAEAMDPVDVITESLRMVENAARDRSVRLVRELESSMIVSDERILRQILINLLSNAVKFTNAGGQVSVRSEIIPSGYKMIISDTGIGMSREEIDLAMEAFGQVHADSRSGKGTGLGLPLVKRFVALIGGNMTIRSAPGHGTSITLELPESVPSAADANQSNNS